MYFCQLFYTPIKLQKIAFYTYNYIFTLLNTIKIIICFDIPHFQLVIVCIKGPSWSYGSWIYNCLCNHCLSQL